MREEFLGLNKDMQKFDSRFFVMEAKIDNIENFNSQMQKALGSLKEDVSILDENALRLQKALQMVEEAIKYFCSSELHEF